MVTRAERVVVWVIGIIIFLWAGSAVIGWMSNQVPTCYQYPQPTICTYNHS